MALQDQRNMVTCDNPLWIACMWNQEHLLSFWLGRTLSYVPLPGTLMRDQLPALFPYLFGGRPTSLPRPIYTPQEHFIYTQVYEAAHFTPRLSDDHYLRHDAQGVLLKTYLWTVIPARYTSLEMAQLPNGQFAQGIRLPEVLQSNFLEHGLGMINFCMNLRSCICFNLWGVWMGLQEHLQQGLGAQLPDHLNDAFVYVALRLEAGRVHNGLQDGTWRMWNRRYCDFFLHSAQDVHFTQLELSTARVYFTGKFKSSYCASLLYHLTPRQSTYHPETGHFRFYHAFLQSEVSGLVGSDDFTLPMDLVLRAAPQRARL